MSIFAAQIDSLMNVGKWKRPVTTKDHVRQLLQDSDSFLTRADIIERTAIKDSTLTSILSQINPEIKNVRINGKNYRSYKL